MEMGEHKVSMKKRPHIVTIAVAIAMVCIGWLLHSAPITFLAFLCAGIAVVIYLNGLEKETIEAMPTGRLAVRLWWSYFLYNMSHPKVVPVYKEFLKRRLAHRQRKQNMQAEKKSNAPMEKIKLPRTGNRPLAFVGEKIASASSRQPNGPCQTRWHELDLYRTESGKYVVAIAYRTQWEKELPEDLAYIEDSVEGIVDALRSATFELPLYAFPPGEQYDERRAHVSGAVRKCYEHAVSELLADIEPETI
jgi:hypothetical protein